MICHAMWIWKLSYHWVQQHYCICSLQKYNSSIYHVLQFTYYVQMVSGHLLMRWINSQGKIYSYASLEFNRTVTQWVKQKYMIHVTAHLPNSHYDWFILPNIIAQKRHKVLGHAVTFSIKWSDLVQLTHISLKPHRYDSESGQQWFR